jgi:para-nitrobenzyl esterase
MKTNPNDSKDRVFVGDEDCLYLNVFRPSGAEQPGAELLPVIVFIHGGYLVTGSASLGYPFPIAVYDGSRLAQNANVVVVTLNYRLGPLGFIGHPELSRTSGYGHSGNYAYMDQIQALRWVHANIRDFGGDPNNVTLSGHSAGATSVWILLTSPLTKDKGLFHHAIVHSGVREGATSDQVAEDWGKELARRVSCSYPDSAKELACMRKVSPEDIISKMPNTPGSGAYPAVVDNYVMKDSPLNMIQNNDYRHVPILQGNVQHERWYGKTIADKPTFRMEINNAMQKGDIPRSVISPDELLDLYPPKNDPSSLSEAYNTIFSDMTFICASREILRALSKKQPKLFVGRFFYTHTYSDGPYVKIGAGHGYELFFIFDTLRAQQVSPTADEAALVKAFQDTWSYFARHGEPPSWWKTYDAQKDNYVIFDTPVPENGELLHKKHLHSEQCDFWDRKINTVTDSRLFDPESFFPF